MELLALQLATKKGSITSRFWEERRTDASSLKENCRGSRHCRVFPLDVRTGDVGRVLRERQRRGREPVTSLSGEWIGKYPDFEQVVRIEDDGKTVTATKVTGNEYVPGDQQTFVADLKTGIGFGIIGTTEGEYSRVPGALHIISRDKILFTWDFEKLFTVSGQIADCCRYASVEFRRDD
jgi:hypothetical protein